jgi:hypothetical protein
MEIEKAKSNRGRKSKPDEEKVKPIPIYAKKKHHEVLAAHFQPLVDKKVIQLEKI